jgi:acylaminoacyl-peptidase
VESFDVSLDKKQILYAAQVYTTFKGKWSQVYCYNVETGETETLYDGTTMQIQRAFWYGGEPIVLGTFAETYGAMENSKFYKLHDNTMTLWIDFDGGLYASVGSDCRYGHGKSFYNGEGKPYFISADNSACNKHSSTYSC